MGTRGTLGELESTLYAGHHLSDASTANFGRSPVFINSSFEERNWPAVFQKEPDI